MPFTDQDKSKLDAALKDFMATDEGKRAFLAGAPKEGDTPEKQAGKIAKVEQEFRGWMRQVNEKGSTAKDGVKDNALAARVMFTDDRKAEAATNYLKYQINNGMLPEAQRQKDLDLDDQKRKKGEAEDAKKKEGKGFLEGAGDFIGDNKGSLIGALMGGLLGFMIGGPIGAIIGLIFGLLIGGQGDKSGGIGGMLGITGKKGEQSQGKGRGVTYDGPSPNNASKLADGHQAFAVNGQGHVVHMNAPDARMAVHGDVKVDKDGNPTMFQVDRVGRIENGKVVGDKNFSAQVGLIRDGNNLVLDESSAGFHTLVTGGANGVIREGIQVNGPAPAQDNRAQGGRLQVANADPASYQAPGAAGGGMIPPANMRSGF